MPGFSFAPNPPTRRGRPWAIRRIWEKTFGGDSSHEHGRQKLDWGDRGEKAVKRGQWNHYEILAVGDRIWTTINGKLAVAIKDPGGDASGQIALQIHSGDPQTVTYKINRLVHNPKVELAGMNEAQLNDHLKRPEDKRQSSLPLKFNPDDVIAFAGGTNIATMRKDGILETLLMAAHPTTKLHLWNLGWDGDTVYEQFRDVGFGSWSKNLDSLGVDVVFVQFGQLESLEGEKALPKFIAAYQKLLNEIRKTDRRIVLLSPIPFEPARSHLTPEGKSNNRLTTAPVEHYTNEIKKLAESEGYSFVDLFHPVQSSASFGTLTTNGMHLNTDGQQLVAELIMKALHQPQEFSNQFAPLRKEVLTKNVLWFNYWRPSNWAFLNGDRITQPFSHDWKDKNRRIFPEEMKAFEPLIREAEQRIADEQRKLAPVR